MSKKKYTTEITEAERIAVLVVLQLAAREKVLEFDKKKPVWLMAVLEGGKK